MSWIEEKYVGLLSVKLNGFKKTTTAWNFRCPFCTSEKLKGYIYQGKHSLSYSCKKCGAGMSFRRLLERLDSELHKQFQVDQFRERRLAQSIPVTPIEKFYKPYKYVPELKGALKISSLPSSHFAKQYVVERLIPNRYHAKLFYVDKFKTFVNSLIPNKFPDVKVDNPRLIIPFFDLKGLFGLQGRSFGDDQLKYISIFFSNEHVRVYGLDDYDPKKRAYLFEGPIDSMFIENGLGMAGASLDHNLEQVGINNSNSTVVYDNEPRNPHIVKFMEDAVAKGYSICVWPNNLKQKDVNEMVRAGKPGAEIKRIIDICTFAGLQASNKISQWKRI